jgi:hypothetical protein
LKVSEIPTTKHASIDSSSPKAEFNYPLSRPIVPPLAAPVAPVAPVEVKPGWQSSEFWLTALIIVGVFVSLILGRIDVSDIANLWPIIAGGVGYALSRGLAKKG